MRPYSGGVRHDYKDSTPRERLLRSIKLNPQGLSWFAVGLVLPLIALVLLFSGGPSESKLETSSERQNLASGRPNPQPEQPRVDRPILERPNLELVMLPSAGERISIPLPPPPLPASSEWLNTPEAIERQRLLQQGEAIELVVRSGDSMDRLFRRNDLSVADLAAMVDLPEARDHLVGIRPGDRFEIIRDDSQVLSLQREVSETELLWIKRTDDGFVAEIIELAVEIRTAGAHGVIESSLWNAAIDAGIEPAVFNEISSIFQWDIDFQLEVRSGDSFTVVYEEMWRDGVKLRNGDIIAAEFVNRGKSFRAARYIREEGADAEHYTPEGMSVKRAFLRNPIEFSRISSNFNPNRRHPILNTIRAHRGVDLAAPTGTVVRAAGDGKIIALGALGTYGNRVELQHGGGITTLYAHLSRFGGFRVGDRVKQGDPIGYVGMTGGATGPHLHYEYRINGVHQNPRTVKLPEASPIDSQYLADFRAQSASLWRQLDLYQGTLLAHNTD